MTDKNKNTPEPRKEDPQLPVKQKPGIALRLGAREEKALKEQSTAFLARSVVLEELDPPGHVKSAIRIVMSVLVIAIVWAAIAKLDERAVTTGEILPQNFIQPVQHLEGGIVRAVLVSDGDQVSAGDPLIVLDETAPLAELQTVRARHAGLALQAARLRSFANGSDADFETWEVQHPDLVADQREILATQVASRDAQLSVVQAQAEEQRQSLSGLAAQRSAFESQLEAVQEEMDLRQELMEKGLASRIVFLETKRQLARTKGDVAELDTRIASTRASLVESEQRMKETSERLKNEALVEMGRVVSERAEVAERLARLEDQVERMTITAPIEGRVNALAFTEPGGVVAQGQAVMEIVPQSQELVASVRISPKDVGHVKLGQAASVRIETFNFSRFGAIEGEVTHVSASSFEDPRTGDIYFKGLIALDKGYTGPDPASNRIAPGMTLTAHVKTGQKTLLAYLLKPISRALDTAFSER